MRNPHVDQNAFNSLLLKNVIAYLESTSGTGKVTHKPGRDQAHELLKALKLPHDNFGAVLEQCLKILNPCASLPNKHIQASVMSALKAFMPLDELALCKKAISQIKFSASADNTNVDAQRSEFMSLKRKLLAAVTHNALFDIADLPEKWQEKYEANLLKVSVDEYSLLLCALIEKESKHLHKTLQAPSLINQLKKIIIHYLNRIEASFALDANGDIFVALLSKTQSISSSFYGKPGNTGICRAEKLYNALNHLLLDKSEGFLPSPAIVMQVVLNQLAGLGFSLRDRCYAELEKISIFKCNPGFVHFRALELTNVGRERNPSSVPAPQFVLTVKEELWQKVVANDIPLTRFTR